MPQIKALGQTTITGKNQVSLPAEGMRRLGWGRGDKLLVRMIDDHTLVLIRRPTNWTETFAGRLGHVFGTHEQTLAWLEEERRGWERESGDVD